MKKFISLVLALVMALSLTTVAWGAGEVAEVDGTPYTDLQAAIDAAATATDKTVTLLDNVTLSLAAGKNYCLLIDAPVTIDGAGKTLTFSGAYDSRAINITTTGNVTIKDLILITNGERGIQVAESPVNLTLENVTATSANYTLNMTTSAGAAKIAIKNCDLTGLCTVNVWGAGSEVTINGGKITCNDQTDVENYRALNLNSSATGATITATGVTFDIKGDSGLASNATDDGEVLIDGSNSGVMTIVAVVEYGDYAYGFTSVQDAIDHAVANSQTEVVVLDTAVNSGESFTPAAGVTVTPPAGASIINNTIVSDSSIGDNTLSGNYFVKGTGAGAVASAAVVSVTDAKAPKDADKNGTIDATEVGNVKYFNIAGDTAKYIQVASVGEADMIVYYGNTDSVFAYLKAVASVEYLGTGVAFNNFGEKCGQYDDEPVAGTKYYLFQGVVYKTVTTSATNLMVGNTLTPVEAMADEFVDHAPAFTYDKDYKVVGVKCAKCGVPATLYANWAAIPKAAQADALALGDGRYYVWGAIGAAGTNGDKVESAETFDAGIAMYVGMSVMAAAGSAVVLKKKD